MRTTITSTLWGPVALGLDRAARDIGLRCSRTWEVSSPVFETLGWLEAEGNVSHVGEERCNKLFCELVRRDGSERGLD